MNYQLVFLCVAGFIFTNSKAQKQYALNSLSVYYKFENSLKPNLFSEEIIQNSTLLVLPNKIELVVKNSSIDFYIDNNSIREVFENGILNKMWKATNKDGATVFQGITYDKNGNPLFFNTLITIEENGKKIDVTLSYKIASIINGEANVISLDYETFDVGKIISPTLNNIFILLGHDIRELTNAIKGYGYTIDAQELNNTSTLFAKSGTYLFLKDRGAKLFSYPVKYKILFEKLKKEIEFGIDKKSIALHNFQISTTDNSIIETYKLGNSNYIFELSLEYNYTINNYRITAKLM